MPKITLFFSRIPVLVTAVLIGVLDFGIVLVLQFSDNTYLLSLCKWVSVNSEIRNRNQQNYLRIFAAQPAEKNAKTLWSQKPMHVYQL